MIELWSKNPLMKRIYFGKVIIPFSLVVMQPTFGQSVIDIYTHEGTSIVSLFIYLCFRYLLSFYGNSAFLKFLLPFYLLLRNYLQGAGRVSKDLSRHANEGNWICVDLYFR